jgi:methylmalonyl-CoA/ethylmalonyl-CoA epimerase
LGSEKGVFGMLKKIDHIGIAVEDLDVSMERFGMLGLNCIKTEIQEEQKVRIGFIPVGDVKIELLEALDADSPIARFILKRGEGTHHIAYEVDDIEEELARLKKDGARLIDEIPRRGAGGTMIAFIHPKELSGVLTELVEKPR